MAIINNSFNFVFVHVPKAAGTSITTVLSKYTNYCDLEIGGTDFGERIQPIYRKRFGLGKHSPATEIRNLVGAVAWSRYFTFSFVRNPFSRCLSTYHFLRKWESPNAEFNAKMRAFESFEEFVMSDIWSQTNGPDEIFRPQAYWLRAGMGSSALLVDYVGHVENIQWDMVEIFKIIGLTKATHGLDTIPVTNRSNNYGSQEFGSSRVVERILEKYNGDFDLFNYSKDPRDHHIHKPDEG